MTKDKFESIGETMFKNAVDLGEYKKEVELKDKLELVGELATALKIQLHQTRTNLYILETCYFRYYRYGDRINNDYNNNNDKNTYRDKTKKLNYIS